MTMMMNKARPGIKTIYKNIANKFKNKVKYGLGEKIWVNIYQKL